MPDISVIFNNNTGTADWQLLNGDVAFAQSDLLSSVMLMLFTDKHCSDDYTPSDGDPRGWWGSNFEPYDIGSRLWQLDRAKFSANTSLLKQASDYTKEAMQPFINQGIASKVTVNVAQIGQNAIQIDITMFQPTQPYPTTFQFAYAWNQVAAVQG